LQKRYQKLKHKIEAAPKDAKSDIGFLQRKKSHDLSPKKGEFESTDKHRSADDDKDDNSLRNHSENGSDYSKEGDSNGQFEKKAVKDPESVFPIFQKSFEKKKDGATRICIR